MATINFKEAIISVEAELKYNKIKVPVVMSYHGIGKTAIAHDIGKRMEAKVFVIEGGLLKEGELGGLPTVVGGSDNSEFDTFMNKLIKKAKTSTEEEKLKLFQLAIKKYAAESAQSGKALPNTVYATFWILAEIDQYLAEDPNNKVLIAFDEINRAERAVMQESMNLVLAKNINGWVVDTDRVAIMAMANPSGEFEEFKDTNYDVQEFDDAQASRFTWFFVHPDLPMWVSYASELNENGVQRVHPDIIEFLTTKEEYFHNHNAHEKITANPRSWEAFSQVYTGLTGEGISPDSPIVFNCARGGLGASAATAFCGYMAGNRSPLISYKDIFTETAIKNEEVDEKMAECINTESFNRMTAAFERIFKGIERKDYKLTDKEVPVLATAITSTKGDLMVAIMRKLYADYRSIHNKLKTHRPYIQTFMEKERLSR